VIIGKVDAGSCFEAKLASEGTSGAVVFEDDADETITRLLLSLCAFSLGNRPFKSMLACSGLTKSENGINGSGVAVCDAGLATGVLRLYC
jgi:hypothetical protein